MLDAIREPWVHLLAAEVEIGFARVAHRPAADPVVEIEQAGLVGHFGAGLGRNQPARRRRRYRGLLIARALAQEPTGADRDDPRHIGGGGGRSRGGCGRRARCGGRARGRGRPGRGFSLGRLGRGSSSFLLVRLDRAGPGLQSQTVGLADHGIAADPAEFVRDLAGGGAAFPHLGQLFDPFVGPAHRSISSAATCRMLAMGAGCG